MFAHINNEMKKTSHHRLMPMIIAGPTASGKSTLALKLARAHDGEIICADSRQFYADMAIGTACPTKEEQSLVPHHGYGIVDAKTTKIDAGFFINFATKKIKEIQERKRRPILVGGTGLYLRALYYGLLDVPPSRKDITAMLEERCNNEGLSHLYDELKKIDPESLHIIKETDRYRIMRALEIYYVTGQKPSGLRKSFNQKEPQIIAHWIYKRPEKESLIKQIENRVKSMFNDGLVDEASYLRSQLSENHWSLSVMGYYEALMYLNKKISLDCAIERTFIRHRQYAKRQYTWFDKEPFYRWKINY